MEGGASCLPWGHSHTASPGHGRPEALRSGAVCLQKPSFEALLILKNWSPLFSCLVRLLEELKDVRHPHGASS